MLEEDKIEFETDPISTESLDVTTEALRFDLAIHWIDPPDVDLVGMTKSFVEGGWSELIFERHWSVLEEVFLKLFDLLWIFVFLDLRTVSISI